MHERKLLNPKQDFHDEHDEQDKRLPFTYVFLLIPSRIFTMNTMDRIRGSSCMKGNFLIPSRIFTMNTMNRIRDFRSPTFSS